MDKNKIIEYLMETSTNTNWAVLKGILGEGEWDILEKYIKKTPRNMNKKILETLLENTSDKDDTNLIIDGTYIFSYEGSQRPSCVTRIDNIPYFSNESIFISIDGATAVEIPRTAQTIYGITWGESDSGGYLYTTYPANVFYNTSNNSLSVHIANAGEHSIIITVAKQ